MKVKVTECGTDYIQVTWSPPETDGGEMISGYLIEKREGEFGRWIRALGFPIRKPNVKVSQICATSLVVIVQYFVFFQVENLTSDEVYQFRVFAKNLVGNSEPSEPSEPARTLALETAAKSQRRTDNDKVHGVEAADKDAESDAKRYNKGLKETMTPHERCKAAVTGIKVIE